MSLLQSVAGFLGQAVVVLVVIAIGAIGALAVVGAGMTPAPDAETRSAARWGCLWMLVSVGLLAAFFLD